MGCYSGPISDVGTTRVFGRVEGDWQILAIEVELTVSEPVALVVPLPVVVGDSDAVRFIDLGESPHFFDHLGRAFDGGDLPPPVADPTPAIEREFIPSMSDLGRLDPAYQLPGNVWSKLGEYWDYGFAVFRLPERPSAAGAERQGTGRLPPLGFRFRTRARAALFFPTVHARADGVPAVATFDHELYMQTVDAFAMGATNANLMYTVASDDFEDQTVEVSGDDHSLPTSPPAGAAGFTPPGWEASVEDAPAAVTHGGVVIPGYPIARRVVKGEGTNVDVWVRL